MEILLEKIGALSYKYELLKNENRFNIFEILRKRDDEVHLHSRFISELLNPKSSHNQGSVFLELFLKEINLEKHINQITKKTSVYSEKYIGNISKDKTKGGRIDIIIENIGKSPIIIENKIYADDQPKQLLRYHNYNKDAKIYYLTLYGTEAKEETLGDMKSNLVEPISYRITINNWLKACIEKTATYPKLREVIIQYQDLIKDLTGNTSTMKEIKELTDLLSKNENILKALPIANNWSEIKLNTELRFWQDLEKIINNEQGYTILETQKYSKEKLQSVQQTRKRNPWYGLTIEVGTFEDKPVYFMIERGWKNLYFGIKMYNEELSKRLAPFISSLLSNPINHAWVGYSYIEPFINFESFSKKHTLLLINDDYREKAIKNLWQVMDEFISNVKNIIKIL